MQTRAALCGVDPVSCQPTAGFLSALSESVALPSCICVEAPWPGVHSELEDMVVCSREKNAVSMSYAISDVKLP